MKTCFAVEHSEGTSASRSKTEDEKRLAAKHVQAEIKEFKDVRRGAGAWTVLDGSRGKEKYGAGLRHTY